MRPIGCFSALVALFVATFAGTAGATASTTTGVWSADDAFVTAAYQDFLGRSPNVQELGANTRTPLATPSARAGFVSGLAFSPEWISVTVDKMYTDTLGRAPDASGETYWASMLSSKRSTVAQMAANFYSSNEYFEGFGHGSTPVWIRDLYTKLMGRPGDGSGVTYWAAQSSKHGRWWVAYNFYQSNESCRTRVESLYQRLLGRDAELSGLHYWATQVKTNGDLVLAAHLATSNEYYRRALARFGSDQHGTWRPLPGRDVPTMWTASGISDNQKIIYGNLGFGRGLDQLGFPGSTLRAVVCSNPCDVPELLPMPAGFQSTVVTGRTSSGEFVGSGTNAAGDLRGLAWPDTNSMPVELAVPTNYHDIKVAGVTSDGVIVGNGEAGASNTHVLVWDSPSDTSPAVLDLPTGYKRASAVGITSDGVIIGNGQDSDYESHGLVWSSTSATPTLLPTASGSSQFVTANAVAPNGEIVGGWSGGGLVWASPSATPTVLSAPSGDTSADVYPLGVSVSGQIVGNGRSSTGSTEAGSSRALVWTSPSEAPFEPSLAEGYSSPSITGVSPTGVVFGGAVAPSPTGTAIGLVWITPTAPPIVLPKVQAPLWNLSAAGVSTSGKVVGNGSDAGHNSFGLVWANTTSQPDVLSTPFGYRSVHVAGVSASGVVFGSAVAYDGSEHGVVWPASSTTPTVLNDPPGYHGVRATGVTATGAIVGAALGSNVKAHPFFWVSAAATPVEFNVPSGLEDITVSGVTSTGVVVGQSNNPGEFNAVTWPAVDAQAEFVPLQPTFGIVSIRANSSSKSMVGTVNYDKAVVPMVWPAPNSMPAVLSEPSGATEVTADTVTSTGLVLGHAVASSGIPVVLKWSSPGLVPITIGLPSNTNVSDIVAGFNGGDLVANLSSPAGDSANVYEP